MARLGRAQPAPPFLGRRIPETPVATFTSEVLKRNDGTVAASSALDYVRWYDPATGALVLSKTGLSTNGSGVFSTTDPALTSGMVYEVNWKESSLSIGRMPRKAAA